MLTRLCVAALVLEMVTSCAPEEPAPPGHGACALVAGDLVITEVFADHAAPAGAAGTDDGEEWIELFAAAGHAVDLSGVELVHSRVDGSREKRVVLAMASLEPGAYLVLGNAEADARPPYVDVGYGARLGDLFNSGGGRIAIQCGATVVDQVTYGDVRAGRSRQLDGGVAPDYTVNDDGARWCDAGDDSDEFEHENRGTPGAANPACAGGAPRPCLDAGVARAAVSPVAGDLRITEVMPNPAGADGVAEWIEVEARRDVDLDGVVVGRDPASAMNRVVLTAPGGGADRGCLHVAAGARAVLARSADATANGGLPAPVALFNLALANAEASVFVAAPDGAVLDQLAWPTSRDGVSIELACGGGTCDGRCEASVEYGPGRHGTPGGANDCGQCLDGDHLRPLRSPGAGDLHVVEWMANPEGAAGERGEYVEVRASAAVDLNGIQLGRSMAALEPAIAAPRCLALGAGDRALFTHADGDLPGGDASFAFALVQTRGTIVVAHDGVVVDQVVYASSLKGRAAIVDDAGKTCAIADDSRYLYNGTDHGTPRAANPACP